MQLDLASSFKIFLASTPWLQSVFNVFNIIWSTYAFLAYIFSILMLVLYVYASSEKKQLQQLKADALKKRELIYDEYFRNGPKNNRLQGIEDYIVSDNPRDWKLAIIEADVVLDEALKKFGYQGVSLGERLRDIAPTKLLSLNDAWQAHKVRNQIAHGDADFILTKRLAEETIKQYKRVFAELGVF